MLESNSRKNLDSHPKPPLSKDANEFSSDPDTKAQPQLSDSLLNRVGVNLCSLAAPREELCFNKAGVKVGSPSGLRALKTCARLRRSERKPPSEAICSRMSALRNVLAP